MEDVDPIGLVAAAVDLVRVARGPAQADARAVGEFQELAVEDDGGARRPGAADPPGFGLLESGVAEEAEADGQEGKPEELDDALVYPAGRDFPLRAQPVLDVAPVSAPPGEEELVGAPGHRVAAEALRVVVVEQDGDLVVVDHGPTLGSLDGS
jgi:hypothetical protein